MGFCPGCGKRIRKGQVVCKECRPDDLKVKDILVKICASCRKYLHKNTWKSYNDLDKAIARIALDNIKENPRGLSVSVVLPEFKANPGTDADFSIEITKGEEVFIVPAKLEVTYCNNCSKKQGEYFEGILQLRNVSESILNYVSNYTKKNNIFVSKQVKAKKGIDLYISDQRKVQQLAHHLQKNFGGTLRISPSVFSRDRQTSKDIHRVNVYYEAPEYSVGDVIKTGNKLVHVTGIRKNILGEDLKTGSHVSVDIKDKDYEILKPVKTRVTKIYPVIEVLDPETYQSIAAENKKEVKRDEKVKIVIDRRKYYLI